MRGEGVGQAEHAPRAARRTGSSRGSRSAREPVAGHRADALAGLGRLGNSPAARRTSLRELVGVATQVAAQRARGRLVGARRAAEARDRCGPGYSDSSVPNCSAITSGAWLGSMMPPAPTRIVVVPAADMADQRPRSPRWRCPACCDARPASSAVAPALGMPGEVERIVQRLGRRRRPRRWARGRGRRRGSSRPIWGAPRRDQPVLDAGACAAPMCAAHPGMRGDHSSAG